MDGALSEHAGLSEIFALERQWSRLWERCPEATVFQGPDWLLPWCEHLLRGAPLVVAVRRGDALVGLAPLFVWDDAGARALSVMGAGVSDYLDVLALPGARQAVIAALDRWLGDSRRWDRAVFSELRASSPLLDLGEGRGWRARLGAQDVCPGLALAPGSTLRDAVPARRWPAITYARRRASREGGLEVEEATAGSCDRLLSHVVRLHAARWRNRGGGAFCSPRVRAFHRAACRRLARSGALELTALSIGERVVAGFYGFRDRRVTRYYASGFDPRYARFSPGTLVVADAIERAAARGAELFDFMRGAEPYKYDWGARDLTTLYRRELWRSG